MGKVSHLKGCYSVRNFIVEKSEARMKGVAENAEGEEVVLVWGLE